MRREPATTAQRHDADRASPSRRARVGRFLLCALAAWPAVGPYGYLALREEWPPGAERDPEPPDGR
jgi:hypothetical protein